MTLFGTTASGDAVQALTLTSGDLAVRLLTLGAILQDVRLRGVAHGLTLGSERLADYEGAMHYHGALVGPVVNRLSGARAEIAGAAHRFEANQDGRITLHSGSSGTHRKLWEVVAQGPDHAVLAVALPDGEGGFPGTRSLTARFEVSAPATLRMTVTATTDAPTLMNVANHSYWNLDGSACWDGHRLQIAADRYLPTTQDVTPTGAIAPVEGTDHDFRQPRRMAPGEPPLDTNFCLGDRRGPLRDVLTLTGRSGFALTLATTEPGVQIYDDRNAGRPGQADYEGIAIEAQFWPDAPSHPDFPQIGLLPGEPWRQVTEWRFATP